MLSVNVSAYKGGIPRNHVLVRTLSYSICRLNPNLLNLPLGYSQEVSFWFANGHRAWLCQLGEDLNLRWLFAHSNSLQSEEISMCINVDSCFNGGLTHFQIKESIKSNTNIFSLAQVIVHSTPCRTTIQLCARVALMVGVALYLSAGTFWASTI